MNETPTMAAGDFDALEDAMLPVAEAQVLLHGTFRPFGAALSQEGGFHHLAQNPTGRATAADAPTVEQLHEIAQANIGQFRSVAIVSPARVGGSDAIRVAFEHESGQAVELLVPYTRTRLTRKVTHGQVSRRRVEPTLWPAAQGREEAQRSTSSDTTGQTDAAQAREDLNDLLNAVIPVAEERYAPEGQLRPFGAAVGVGGELLHFTSDRPEDTAPEEVTAHLVEIARDNAERLRAASIVSLVRHGGGDGIRVAIDYRDDEAVNVVFPVTRDPLTSRVTRGEHVLTTAQAWVWTESEPGDPAAPTWRAEVPQSTQDDLDALYGQLIPFAEQTLGQYGELHPFGGALDLEGNFGMHAAQLAGNDRPPSQELVDILYDGARKDAHRLRTFGVVSDVLLEGGADAIRLQAEHRDGTAIVVLLPYARDTETMTISVAGASTRLASPRVWPVAQDT
jgi:hypothetical protein